MMFMDVFLYLHFRRKKQSSPQIETIMIDIGYSFQCCSFEKALVRLEKIFARLVEMDCSTNGQAEYGTHPKKF